MVGRIKGFDGLRALSVMLVIMSHASIWTRLEITNPGVLATFSAHAGVNVFFVLSGFLITNLLISEHKATGTISYRKFFMRRALRIFPLYFLAVTLLFIFDKTNLSKIPDCSFLFAYTYTLNFAPRACTFSSMSHFWSLAVEEHFYLLWPLVFLLGKRIACTCALIFATVCLLAPPVLAGWFPGVSVNRWTIPAAAPIAFGCIVAFIYTHHHVSNFFASQKNAPFILLAAITGLASPAFLSSELVWLMAVSLLLLYVIYNQNSWLVRALEVKPLASLGVISYGLYVWQGVFTGNGPYRSGGIFPPSVELGLWLTFLAAPLSYMFFERPMLALKRRFSWRSEAMPAVSHAKV